VTQRTPETAVRIAVGASRGSITGLALRQSLDLMAVGIVIGTAAAWAITRAPGKLVRVDMVTLAAVAALLALVGAAATLVPAWRAARVDPVAALRME
jgi:ABC-type antimicrobial peptide transport system permease subunit